MTDFAQRRVMMVDTQVRPNDVTKFPVIEAMLAVPREQFVPSQLADVAYSGQNLPLGPGRVELEPRSLSKMLDGLNPQPDERVLCIGAGMGYTPAVLSRLAGEVVAFEPDPELAASARGALSSVTVVEQDSDLNGVFDAIFVNGAVEELPEGTEALLAEGGRIVAIFAEGALGITRFGLKRDGRLNWRFGFNADAPVLPGCARTKTFTL